MMREAYFCSDYRKTFWKMAKPALTAGNIEGVIHVRLVAHHLISFTKECTQGLESASFYSQKLSKSDSEKLTSSIK